MPYCLRIGVLPCLLTSILLVVVAQDHPVDQEQVSWPHYLPSFSAEI